MSDAPIPARTKIGAATGLAGAAVVLALVIGVGPAPSVFQLVGANEDLSGSCDEAEHADDPECQGAPAEGDDDTTSATVDDSTSTPVGAGGGGTDGPADEVRTLDAAGAGLVVYAVESGSFRLVSATPSAGWRVDVEQSAGREIDLDFRSGTRRVQVDIELEDGQVRERVRFRDDATDERIETEGGVVVQDDHSGPGSGDDDSDDDSSSGPGSDDDPDDDSDSGSGSDDDPDDDSDSGPGSDDSSDDDSSGSSGRDHPEDD